LDWFLNPPPVDYVPTEALVAIASVAVVIWTGGFIVRGWMGSTSIALLGGMNYLQFAFFSSIMALLANALTLRCLAIAFLLYYGSFFIRYSSILKAREPEIELFLPLVSDVKISSARFWPTIQVIELIPLIITFIWPDPRVLAWCCAAMTFFGYQIILAFVYKDLFQKP
jgi:hypothetical protein